MSKAKYGYIRWNHGNAYWHETEDDAWSKPNTRIQPLLTVEAASVWWDAVLDHIQEGSKA
jgi:hypothetical protein